MNYLKVCTILYVMSLCSCTGLKSLSFAKPIKSDANANLIVKPQERAIESTPQVKNLGNDNKPKPKAPDNKQPFKTKEPEILPVKTKEPEKNTVLTHEHHQRAVSKKHQKQPTTHNEKNSQVAQT